MTRQQNPPGINAIKKRVSEIRLNLEMFIADYSGKDLNEISRALQLAIDAIDDEFEARYEAVGHDV
jgi:hypothetical protein